MSIFDKYLSHIFCFYLLVNLCLPKKINLLFLLSSKPYVVQTIPTKSHLHTSMIVPFDLKLFTYY